MQSGNAITPLIYTTTKTSKKQHRNTITTEVQTEVQTGTTTNTTKDLKHKRRNKGGRPNRSGRDNQPGVNIIHKRDDGGLAKHKLHPIKKIYKRRGVRHKQNKKRRVLDQNLNNKPTNILASRYHETS